MEDVFTNIRNQMESSTMTQNAAKYVCHTALFPTGERFPVLLYENSYQPVVLITRYVIDERREICQSSTLERDTRVLKWFYEWCDLSKIDIEERLRTGKTTAKAEVTGFCRYLRARRNEAIVGSIGTHKGQGRSGSPVLSPKTFNSYIGVVESFLVWAAYEFIPVRTPEDAIRENLRSAIKSIKHVFRSVRKGGHTVSNRRGLTRAEVEEIRQIIKPGAARNPFKKSVQFRNYLIFELMLATGIRRGELLKIKLKHLPSGPKVTLSIVRSPDDRDDPRRNEPQVKTRIREIPLHKQLRVELWKYVQKHRKKSGRGHYLVTSLRGGGPLNLGGVNGIFSFLVKKQLPHFKGKLSPHTMRHTYNEWFVELADSLGWPEGRIKDVQRYLNGWSERSTMPVHYTRRVIEAQAMEIAEKFQDALYVC